MLKIGDLELYVSLGAIAQWEEIRGKKFLTAFNETTFALNDLAELVFQMHRIASKRTGANIKMDASEILDSFTYADMVICLSDATPEILKLYGTATKEDTKKKK
jgi:hypothetical protein